VSGNDKPETQPESLRSRLDELESLLGDEEPSGSAVPRANLPVLDDVVEPATSEGGPEYRSDADQLAELAERLEQRLCAELESLVGVLKDVVRRQIKQELHDTLRRESDTAEQAVPPAPDRPDPD